MRGDDLRNVDGRQRKGRDSRVGLVAREKKKEEKLFSAAVLRRSFELRGEEHKEAFRFVYEGVLRDLSLEDAEVEAFLAKHEEEVESAIGRGKG